MFFIQSGKCDVVVEKQIVMTEMDLEKRRKRKQSIRKRLSMGALFTRSPKQEASDSDDSNDDPLDSQSSFMMTSMRESPNATTVRTVEEAVKELATGDYFGEIALVTDSKRTASIRSRTFTELLVLSRDAFNDITENNRDEREEMKDQILKRCVERAAFSNVVFKPPTNSSFFVQVP